MSYSCLFTEFDPYKTMMRRGGIDVDVWQQKWQTENLDYSKPYEELQKHSMPFVVVHHGQGGTWNLHNSHNRLGCRWHLTEDDPRDLNINARYYPTIGISKDTVSDIEFKEKNMDKLNDWVMNIPNQEKYIKQFGNIIVPCIYLFYQDGLCWTTKKPFPGNPIQNYMTATAVYPNPFKPLDRHSREDEFFGDPFIEFDNKKYYLGNLQELEVAYNDLKHTIEINRL